MYEMRLECVRVCLFVRVNACKSRVGLQVNVRVCHVKCSGGILHVWETNKMTLYLTNTVVIELLIPEKNSELVEFVCL